jgi:hypothetical protein
MRTAFCFSGELRSLDKTFPSIDKNIVSKFSNVDFFVYTWADDPDLHKMSIFEKDKRTKHILTEDRITYDEKMYNARKRPEVFIQGMLRQLHCLKRCNDIKKEYENNNNFKYDCVVRIRPDILPINSSSLENSVEEWDMKNYMYTSDHDDWFGYNDRLYFSNSSNMDYICSRIEYIDDYFNYGGLMHYETYLKHCIEQLNIKVCRSRLEFVLLRNDGTYASELTMGYNIENR